jgi:hypothetical protein
MGTSILDFYPEDGGSRFLSNVNTCLLNYMASHPRRHENLRFQAVYTFYTQGNGKGFKHKYG